MTRITPEYLARSGTEHGHQAALFCWLGLNWPAVNDVCYAIPNGRKRNAIDAGALKAEGVKAGVPDVNVCWPFGGYAGLFIEMKKPTKGVVADKQTVWHERLAARGYKVVTCYGWKEAVNAIFAYFAVSSRLG